jgi:hypothetical protein
MFGARRRLGTTKSRLPARPAFWQRTLAFYFSDLEALKPEREPDVSTVADRYRENLRIAS